MKQYIYRNNDINDDENRKYGWVNAAAIEFIVVLQYAALQRLFVNNRMCWRWFN